MKSYKDFEKQDIGGSEIAALVVCGCQADGTVAEMVNFGEDGSYAAYIVDGKDIKIGEHYKKVLELNDWITIYDDFGRKFHKRADHINIWRAGEKGCIIQTWND